jgi:membrane dipeptidase
MIRTTGSQPRCRERISEWFQPFSRHIFFFIMFTLPTFSQTPMAPDTLVQKAKKLHYSLLTVDTHEDTPSRLAGFNVGERHEPGTPGAGEVDLPRMKEGGLAAAFFAVFTGQGPCTPEGREKARGAALRTLELLDTMFHDHADLCERALSVQDARRIFRTGKRVIFIGMENGYPIGLDVSNVDIFFKRGVRYITLAHSADNDLCDSGTDDKHPEDRGLSELGAQVVRRMNKLGIMVDVSHVSQKSFFDVLNLTKAPVIASHSCARALRDHPRNLTDTELEALKKNGGVIQVTFVGDFLKRIPPIPEKDTQEAALNKRIEAKGGWQALRPDEEAAFRREFEAIRNKYPQAFARVQDVVDHIDHIVKVIGVDHVGIGTDFDGGGYLADCRDVTEMSTITVELMRRGYSEDDIRKIWGENLLRVMGEVEMIARSLQQ